MTEHCKWLFQDSPALLLLLDNALTCRDMTSVWRQQLGLQDAADEMVDTCLPAADLFAFDSNRGLLEQFNAVINDGSAIVDAEVDLLMADGTVKARLSAWRIQNHAEEQPCVMVAATDLGEYERAYQELSRLQIQHQLILDAAGEGVYGLDCNGKITFTNAAATEILGWKAEDVEGHAAHEVHHHSHADGSKYPRIECPIYAALQDGEVHRIDNEVFWHIDGSAVPVEYISTPIRENGKLNGAVVIFRDISARKEIEKQREAAFVEIKKLKEQLEQERDYLREESNANVSFGEIIGDSQALKRTLAQVEAVANTPVSVLILGESGVGKEMIARALHTKSDRVEKPLVKVNCASIPRDLFESEFFGHVRGAFTGAHQDRIGRLQLADGGTLFLDEIGEIPMSQQGKLLRALQEGEFERVGDDKTIKVNVRVVAATNRDLMDAIKDGKFREDLFYRISVFPVEVPPLRKRIDDVPLLALHFLEQICSDLGRETLRMSQQDVTLLKQQDWPGNIRELKNVIERAVISSSGNRLRLDLAVPKGSGQVQPSTLASPESSGFLTLAEFKQLEKANMIAALKHADWKVWGTGGAADLLGTKPSTLAYQMKAFGISKQT